MKLLVIGRDAHDCDIVLSSEFVSNYHAEILLMDNGEMYLVDKSTNGTFLNGNRVVPGTENKIRRGDKILFADAPLNWGQVPENRVPENVRQNISIGTHHLNDIKINSAKASRFHATLRLMSDGKWYICDHSTNGTTVGNRRLPKDQFVRLKGGESINCAGCPIKNPAKGGNWLKIVLIILAALLVVGAATWGILSSGIPQSDVKIYERYQNSVLMVRSYYHYKVDCGAFDIRELPDPDRFNVSLPREFIIGEYGEIIPFDGKNYHTRSGSGFFVGDEGYVASNKLMAQPWNPDLISAERILKEKINHLIKSGNLYAINFSTLKVSGVLDEVIVCPNNSYLDSKEVYNCNEVRTGADDEENIALFKLRGRVPEEMEFVPLSKINDKNVELGKHVIAIGFPKNNIENMKSSKSKLHADYSGGEIGNTAKKYQFGISALTHSAIGSPIFDNKGKLVGIMDCGYDEDSKLNYAVRSRSLAKLVEIIEEEKE